WGWGAAPGPGAGGGRVRVSGAALRSFAGAGPADVRALLDQLLDGLAGELRTLIDRERIGMSGHSFGGWTTLVVTAQDRRIRAALPLAPAGGAAPPPPPAPPHAPPLSRGPPGPPP